MSSERPPVHEMVKNAVESLGGIATYKQIIEWIDEKFRNVNHGTIRAQTIACSVNQPSRVHYPENQKERNSNPKYDLFFSVGRGKVEIFDTVKHGNWGIVEKKGKFKITHEGKIIGISEINEFYFIEKDFESTTKNKEDSQYLRERFQTLEGVLKNNSKQLFDNTNSYTGQAWNQGYKAWNDYQWLGFWRHGTKIESIQFQVSLGKEQELGIGIWLDGGADNTRKHALEKIKNNKEEFLKLIEDLPNSYDIGIKKRDKTTIVKKLSDLHDVEFFETVIEELSKNKTEFFIERKIFKDEVINFETKIVDEILNIFNNLVPVSDVLSIKNPENTESTLLKYVRGEWAPYANYQPIIIKELLESGFENSYSLPIKKIDEKIEQLNFGRDTFRKSSYKTSAYPTLKKFVKNENDIIILEPSSFTQKDVQECLELCDKRIARHHVEEIMKEENNIYFIQAGEESKWLKEFEETKTVGITHPNAKFDLSNMSKNEIQNKTDGEYGTELFNMSQIKKGDIIAITTGSKQGIENFGIATSDYYCDSKSNTYNHKIDVEYLNFGTNKINSNTPKAIIKSDQEVPKIKEFLIGKNSMAAIKAHSCFILTQNPDSRYDDVEGKQYQYDSNKANSRKLIEGSKFVIQSKIDNQNYFIGFGKIVHIEFSSDTSPNGREITKYVAKFKDYEKFEQAQIRTPEIHEEMKSMESHGSQPPAILPITRSLYKKITGEDIGEDESMSKDMSKNMSKKESEIVSILNWKPNVILYGPPGTGKTYHCNQIIKELTKDNENKIAICWPTDVNKNKIEDFSDVIKQHNKVLWGVGWKQTKIKKSDFPVSGYIYHRGDIIGTATISDFTTKEDTTSDELELRPSKWKGEEDSAYYLHITDIDRCIPFSYQKLQKHEDGESIQGQVQTGIHVREHEQFKKFVTFHPSYSYEDFIEGIRPETINGKVIYNLKDGIFKKICYAAKTDLNPENKYVLVIDEVNRGNIPKIFGELITLIENDKRDNLSLNLAYSQKEFTVPKNLYIIGTMNTADTSLIHMDSALRRRFAFMELMPDYELKEINRSVGKIHLGKLLKTLNEKVRKENLRDKQIGHSYFMGIKNISELQQVFKYEIIPLLQDYFYEDYKLLEKILGKNIISKNEMSVNDKVINNPDEFETELEKITTGKIETSNNSTDSDDHDK